MSDKFKANIRIALPAAIATLAVYCLQSMDVTPAAIHGDAPSAWLVLPYLVVIITALCRMNVTIVLSLGILSAFLMGLSFGFKPLEMASFMGKGIDGMGNLIVITLMSAGMLGLVKSCGGISWLLQTLTARIRGIRGAEACIAVLVGLVNMCKAASLLDTASCIVQCLIPYGAQTLLATSLAGLSPAEPFPYLYYPWALAFCVAIAVIIPGNLLKKKAQP